MDAEATAGLRRRPARAAAEETSPADGLQPSPAARGRPPPRTGPADGVPPERLEAMNGLRTVASILIAMFHGRWWLSQLMREHEMFSAPGAWWLASFYVVVDVFLAITGYLTARSLLLGKDGGFFESMRGRFWRIMPPLAFVLAVAAACFWGNRTWPRAYTRNEVDQQLAEAVDPGREWQGTNLGAWWTHLVHMCSLAPVGGFLIHGWSIAVQFLWWALFPLAFRTLSLGKGVRLPAAVGVFAVCHAALRGWMWWRLAQFESATALGRYLMFSFYVSAPARSLALGLGALAAWVALRRPALLVWLRGPSRAALASRLVGWALVALSLGLNCIWEFTFGMPAGAGRGWLQGCFYVLGQPGGSLTALAWVWVVVAAVADVPLIGSAYGPGPASPPPPLPPPLPQGVPPPRSSAPPASSLTRCMAWRGFSALGRASYWLYLVHPVVFAVALPAAHFLMPASSLRLPVPSRHGLASMAAGLGAVSARAAMPLPVLQMRGVPGSQIGWAHPAQVHWLAELAADRGLSEGEPLSPGARGAGLAAAMVLCVGLSALLAVGLEAAVERPCAALAKRVLAAAPAVDTVLGHAVDCYSAALALALPVAHGAVNIIWLTSITPESEAETMGAMADAVAAETVKRASEIAAERLAWMGDPP